MIKCVIDSTIIPQGYYALHVVENGHIPGVLSGAEIKGRAATYGVWYSVMRRRMANLLHEIYEISDDKVLINSRWCRVWNKNGKPVQCVVE